TQTSFIDGVQAPQVVFRPHCIFEVSPERSCHQRPRMSTSSEKLTAFHLGVTERPSRLSRLYCVCDSGIGRDGCCSCKLLPEGASRGPLHCRGLRSPRLIRLTEPFSPTRRRSLTCGCGPVEHPWGVDDADSSHFPRPGVCGSTHPQRQCVDRRNATRPPKSMLGARCRSSPPWPRTGHPANATRSAPSWLVKPLLWAPPTGRFHVRPW